MDILLKQVDSLYMKVICDDGIATEIYEYFSYFAKNYQYMEKYKAGIWDGKIRLYNIYTKNLYIGLKDSVIKFANKRGYSYKLDFLDYEENININDFLNNLKLKFNPYDHQRKFLKNILDKKKCLLESATSSGKSYGLYLASKYLMDYKYSNIVIVVPTTALVEQMYKDFISYDEEIEQYCTRIYADYKDKNKNRITISTWQSLITFNKKWFEDVDAVFVDEVHEFDHKSGIKICESFYNVEYRIGVTGTMKTTKSNKVLLTGLFGAVQKIIKAKELIDKNMAANVTVKALELIHTNFNLKSNGYQQEVNYLIENDKRNNFLINLACKQDDNTVILFQFVEKHQKKLLELAKEKYPDKQHFIVNKDVKTKDREYIREYCETNNDAVIWASYKTMSKGISIKNLKYGICAFPLKEQTIFIQAIGRLIRLSNDKNKHSIFYDIGDKIGNNITYKHFESRLKAYKKEEYEIQNIQLKL